ncbi:hypothetical protein BURMUCGD2M_6339 [Burkholderia multivorans CGD2M]|nr:hypothetical protein BURMUCGD2M_6339 [Burkholderia multivorans CGD2M]
MSKLWSYRRIIFLTSHLLRKESVVDVGRKVVELPRSNAIMHWTRR